jgi:hypothetical protein
VQFDQDYYPGRRKRGKDYKEDMVCSSALDVKCINYPKLFSFVADYCLLSCSMNFHSTILDRFCLNISSSPFSLQKVLTHCNHVMNG